MLTPASIGRNFELLTRLHGSSSENWGFCVIVTWLPVIIRVTRVTWRQQLSVDRGEGVTTSITVQRRAFFGNVDWLSHTSMGPILLSVFHPPWWSCGCVPLGGHILGNQGAGAPSSAWIVASQSHLHRRLGSWRKWYGTPLHIAPPLRVCPSVGPGMPLWCCTGRCE